MKEIPEEYMEQFQEQRLNNIEVEVVDFRDPPEIPDEVLEVEAEEIEPDALLAVEEATGGISEEDIEAIPNLLVDGVCLLKHELSSYFKYKFQEEAHEEFSKSEKYHLDIIIALDQEGSLDMISLQELAEKIGVPFKSLLAIKVRYVALKERWRSTELEDYMKEGIRRNARKVVMKYASGKEPDPLVMLGGYMLVSLGGDVSQLIRNNFGKEAVDG